MKHPYAQILMAIANEEQIQWQDNKGEWETQISGAVLEEISQQEWPPHRYRIKPKTVMVNGVECPEQSSNEHYKVSILGPEVLDLWYATKPDALTVFNALVKPFKEAP